MTKTRTSGGQIQRMSARRVAHVAKVRSPAEWRAVEPYLRDAYRLAQREHDGA